MATRTKTSTTKTAKRADVNPPVSSTVTRIRKARRAIQAQIADLDRQDRQYRDLEAKALADDAPPIIVEGLTAWVANACYYTAQGYRLKATGRIAPWSRAFRRYFEDNPDMVYRAGEAYAKMKLDKAQ